MVLLAHFQVDARVAVPGQGETEYTLYQQVISQSLDKYAADRLREIQPDISETGTWCSEKYDQGLTLQQVIFLKVTTGLHQKNLPHWK